MHSQEIAVAAQLASRAVSIAALSVIHSLGQPDLMKAVEDRAFEILGTADLNGLGVDRDKVVEQGQKSIRGQIDTALAHAAASPTLRAQ